MWRMISGKFLHHWLSCSGQRSEAKLCKKLPILCYFGWISTISWKCLIGMTGVRCERWEWYKDNLPVWRILDSLGTNHMALSHDFIAEITWAQCAQYSMLRHKALETVPKLSIIPQITENVCAHKGVKVMYL